MIRLLRALVISVGVSAASPVSAADKLCGELDQFIADQEAEKGDPMPRHWVEFHWGVDPNPDSFWSWGCRHSQDKSSAKLCIYLMDHTSREFRNLLPVRVLKCMNNRFPDEALQGWHVTEGEFRHQRKNGSWLVMEVTERDLQSGESAVRISYDTVDRKLQPEELSPIRPLGGQPPQTSR